MKTHLFQNMLSLISIYKTYNGELPHLTGAAIPPILTENEPRKKNSYKRDNFLFTDKSSIWDRKPTEQRAIVETLEIVQG